jgi:hypothetical protein
MPFRDFWRRRHHTAIRPALPPGSNAPFKPAEFQDPGRQQFHARSDLGH